MGFQTLLGPEKADEHRISHSLQDKQDMSWLQCLLVAHMPKLIYIL